MTEDLVVRLPHDPPSALIEDMCRAAYGRAWDGPEDKMPGPKMKEVWRDHARKYWRGLVESDALERRAPAEGELVEAVRKIIEEHDFPDSLDYPKVASLVTALILERAAKVADAFPEQPPFGEQFTAGGEWAGVQERASRYIAAAIRSLARPST